MKPEKSASIPNDNQLLQSMLERQEKAPELYQPGPYWLSKTKCAAKEIIRYGLNDFRGQSSNISTSYGDNVLSDRRKDYDYGLRSSLLAFVCRKFRPVSHIFDSQVHLTRAYFGDCVAYKNQIANHSSRVMELLQKYKLPHDTIRGGCLDVCEIEGKKISNHYLDLLDIHDVLVRDIDFSAAKTFFEIGGGFGVNVHILIENYPNLKKVVYLDIAPNLFVGMQYLRSFYGNKVKSFFDVSNTEKLSFSPDDTLEIFCITPDQIEQLDVEIDIFQNCRSFVEMPENVTKNYATHIQRLMHKDNPMIALVSYKNFDPSTTYHPDKLPEFFAPLEFDKLEEKTLWKQDKYNLYYVSKPKK